MDIAVSVDGIPIRLTSERWFPYHGLLHGQSQTKKSDLDEITTTTVASFPTVLQAVPYLTDFPSQRFSVDYDTEVDVLYIGLERPQQATNSVMTEDGILLRCRDDQLVGITILEASTR